MVDNHVRDVETVLLSKLKELAREELTTLIFLSKLSLDESVFSEGRYN